MGICWKGYSAVLYPSPSYLQHVGDVTPDALDHLDAVVGRRVLPEDRRRSGGRRQRRRADLPVALRRPRPLLLWPRRRYEDLVILVLDLNLVLPLALVVLAAVVLLLLSFLGLR